MPRRQGVKRPFFPEKNQVALARRITAFPQVHDTHRKKIKLEKMKGNEADTVRPDLLWKKATKILRKLPKFSKSYQKSQKLPKFSKSYQKSQKLPKISKSYQNSPKVTKILQKLPKFSKSYQKSPKVTNILKKLPKQF
jgi:hypothetical protein